jgi:hypothetical protein
MTGCPRAFRSRWAVERVVGSFSFPAFSRSAIGSELASPGAVHITGISLARIFAARRIFESTEWKV